MLPLLEAREDNVLDLRRVPPLLLGATGQADVPALRTRAKDKMLALRQARAGRRADRPWPAMPCLLAAGADGPARLPALPALAMSGSVDRRRARVRRLQRHRHDQVLPGLRG